MSSCFVQCLVSYPYVLSSLSSPFSSSTCGHLNGSLHVGSRASLRAYRRNQLLAIDRDLWAFQIDSRPLRHSTTLEVSGLHLCRRCIYVRVGNRWHASLHATTAWLDGFALLCAEPISRASPNVALTPVSIKILLLSVIRQLHVPRLVRFTLIVHMLASIVQFLIDELLDALSWIQNVDHGRVEAAVHRIWEEDVSALRIGSDLYLIVHLQMGRLLYGYALDHVLTVSSLVHILDWNQGWVLHLHRLNLVILLWLGQFQLGDALCRLAQHLLDRLLLSDRRHILFRLRLCLRN